MIGILVGLGIITALMCILNLMAYDVLEDYSVSLRETVVGLQTATDAGELVEVMVDIQSETNENRQVSEELIAVVNRFKKL